MKKVLCQFGNQTEPNKSEGNHAERETTLGQHSENF